MFPLLYKSTPYFDIQIIESNFEIIVTQRWRIINNPRIPLAKIEHFKRMAKGIINALWNYKFWVRVKGTSRFAIKNKRTVFNIRFQLEWVYRGEHWRVDLSPTSRQSSVNWYNRRIELDLEDTQLQEKIGSDGKILQYPIAHEFGHTIGNIRGFVSLAYIPSKPYQLFHRVRHDDEYKIGGVSPRIKYENRLRRQYVLDKNSIMNIGNQIRDRHIDFILLELNSMFRDDTEIILDK